MEWDDLRHFLAVARTGSLTDAARALRSSAATVSRHIEALEEKLGAQLFERRSTGYLLTETGTAVLAKDEESEEAVLSLEKIGNPEEIYPPDRVGEKLSDRECPRLAITDQP